MYYTYARNTTLKEVTYIPKTVKDMGQTFLGCTALEKVATIPNSVCSLDETFSGCTSLTGTITINVNPDIINDVLLGDGYTYAFRSVDFQEQKLTLSGSCDDAFLDELGATGRNYCDECNGWCKDAIALFTDGTWLTLDQLNDSANSTKYGYKSGPIYYNGRGYVVNRGAFMDCTTLVSIKVPEGTVKLDYQCFERCTNLTSIELPSTLKIISNTCFSYTSITTLTIPASVEMISYSNFSNVSTLTSIIFEDTSGWYKYSKTYAEWDNSTIDNWRNLYEGGATSINVSNPTTNANNKANWNSYYLIKP